MNHNVQGANDTPVKHYDYIIAGAGAAGLSLLVKMIRSGNFTQKKVLLVDREAKNKNDRTWCFWEKGTGFFEDVVFKKWPALWFHAAGFSRKLEIAPYQYKMIRGIDFYAFCFKIIAEAGYVTVRYGSITQMQSTNQDSWLLLDGQRFTAQYIFNSIIFERPILRPKEYYLLQHFRGWLIKTATPVFNDNEATLMDFRVDQQHGASFVYVMPFTTTRALVEYTVFSENLLDGAEYDEALAGYIDKMFGCAYIREEQEVGSIPMTNHPFPGRQGNIMYIGTAGGQTKASSGYTFQFIQKSTAAIVDALSRERNPFLPKPASRFNFYDSVLLDVLATGKVPGDKVFSLLFRKNTPQRIFSFLDNESSFFDDLRIISSLPTLPFLKAGMQQVF